MRQQNIQIGLVGSCLCFLHHVVQIWDSKNKCTYMYAVFLLLYLLESMTILFSEKIKYESRRSAQIQVPGLATTAPYLMPPHSHRLAAAYVCTFFVFWKPSFKGVVSIFCKCCAVVACQLLQWHRTFKLKVILHAEKMSNLQAPHEFGVDKKKVRRWRKQWTRFSTAKQPYEFYQTTEGSTP